MTQLKLDFVKDSTGGQVLSSSFEVFSGIGTDTRKNLSGQLFLALKGESFDAHQFVPQAVEQGAHGVLIHEWRPEWESLKSKTSFIQVDDTLKALQDLAHAVRKKSKAKFIALTGSNGKTTTKEFTAAILSTRRKVHYSKGSFNNHWGVPFSILALEPQHEVVVLEMGMNHAGEIKELTKIAEPDVVVCTTVGTAHIEHFGSQEAIAKAKEEIYEYSPMDSTRVYNIDNPFTKRMHQKGQGRFNELNLLTFSNLDPKADLYLKFESMSLESLEVSGHISGLQGRAKIAVFGQQNLTNLAAAGALALAEGLTPQEIWKGFENCKTNWGRNQLLELASGGRMIFDAYNANPDSMKALISNVKTVQVAGRKIGVFGEMLELGDFSAGYHQELGEIVGMSGFSSVYFIGPDVEAFRRGLNNGLAKVRKDCKQTLWRDFHSNLAEELAGEIRSGDLVVVKGSRGMKLERFVEPCQPKGFSLSKE